MSRRQDEESLVGHVTEPEGGYPAGPFQTGHLVTRREFFTRLGGSLVLSGGLVGAASWLHRARGFAPARSRGGLAPRSFRVPVAPGGPHVVVVRGGDRQQRIHAALRQLGGLGHFIHRGDKVLLKPNMAWDRHPSYAANTDPLVVETMARLCLTAGAAAVYVADNPVADGKRAARSSGIQVACKRAGAKLVLPGGSDFVRVRLDGKQLADWPMLRLLFQVDKVIDLPVPKHHTLSRFTGAMKNWIGITGGTRRRLHQNIHQSIVDLVAAFPPTLVVADAGRILMRHGPTGGRLSDVKTSDILVAGVDPATVDAALLPLLGLKPNQVEHVVQGAVSGLGTLDLSNVAHVTLG